MGGMQNNASKSPKQAGGRAYTGRVGATPANRAEGSTAWRDVDQPLIGALVYQLSKRRAGCLLGVTKDGGTAAVTVFLNDERLRFYPKDADDLEALLKDLINWADADEPDFAYFTGD